MTPLAWLLTIALAVGSPARSSSSAAAVPGASGLVDDPCPPERQPPQVVVDYMRAVVDPMRPRLPRPVAAFDAYAAQILSDRATDWAQLCRYRRQDLRLAGRPATERRIVYIGDSITEIWGIADPAFFTEGRVNRGISGQTTGQMLLRFQADVVALHPAVVHILGGGNDIAGNNGPESVSDVRNNIAAMTALAQAAGIRVVLGSITPAIRLPWKPTIAPAPQIAAMNRWLADHARRIGATFVDYHALLADPVGGLPADLTFDGVHPNLPGYRRIEAASRAATDAAITGGGR